jgi:hypothetical protein
MIERNEILSITFIRYDIAVSVKNDDEFASEIKAFDDLELIELI